jgi:hypothetical protein
VELVAVVMSVTTYGSAGTSDSSPTELTQPPIFEPSAEARSESWTEARMVVFDTTPKRKGKEVLKVARASIGKSERVLG